MKVTKKGGQFSRRTVREYESRAEAEADTAEAVASGAIVQDSSPDVRWFDDYIDSIIDDVTAHLRSKGLPATPIVYAMRGAEWMDAESWRETEPVDDDRGKVTTCDDCVIELVGYDDDSLEGLCARIVTAAHWMRKNSGHPPGRRWAFELGRLVTLANAYYDLDQRRHRGADVANAQWDGPRSLAIETARELIKADTDQELTKEDLIRCCLNEIERHDHRKPHPETLWRQWLKPAGILPDYITRSGRRT